MKYEAKNLDTHKKSVKIGVVLAGLFLIIYGSGVTPHTKLNIMPIVLGALLILSALLIKEVFVNEDGLSVFYNMRIATHKELWLWSDLYAITWQKDKKYPDLWLLYFTKDDRTRKFYFSEEDMHKILELAKKKNSFIKIYKALKDK